MLATSAPTEKRVHVRQATSTAVYLNSGVRLSVSYCSHVFFLFKVADVCTVRWYKYKCKLWLHVSVQGC